MRLFRSEFLRARSRRLVPMVIIGGLARRSWSSMGIAAFNSHAPTPATLDQAQAQLRPAVPAVPERQVPRAATDQLPPGYASLEAYCSENVPVRTSTTPACRLRDLPEILQGIATFVILLGALLGASLGGADWTSNTMTTLLTWEPRRIRVLLTRALVVVLVVFVVSLVLQAMFVGALLARCRDRAAPPRSRRARLWATSARRCCASRRWRPRSG